MESPLRILVVDDTVTYRAIVSNALAGVPNVEVVGIAANGKIALQKIAQLHPDLLTLDLEMPEMDGLEVLRRLRSAKANVAEAAGCATFQDLARQARSPSKRALQHEIIDAITTQETLFFRDDSPFEALRNKALPELIDRKAGTAFSKRLRIWSAASSTGQEPYSIAMTLCETIPDWASWDINILGTDISNAAIRQASAGRYAGHEIQRGMKPQMLNRHFRQETGGWKVKDELRAMVSFGRRNLLEPFVELGLFDIIFCRNVAIYFDAPTRRNFFLRLTERLAPLGYLFVGSSECLIDLGPQFVPQHHCRGTYYQPHKTTTAATTATKAAAVRPAAYAALKA